MTTNRSRRRGDDLLPQVGAAAALDQPAVGRDLVGPVDRDVEALEAAELLDRDAQPPRLFLGRDRGRDAADAVEAARGERRQQVGDRRAGAEPDRHSVLHELGGGLGGEALLVVGGHRPGLYARGLDGCADLADGGGRRAALDSAARGPHGDRPRPRGRPLHRGRGDLLEPRRDREPRRGPDGDRPRQPQRHRAERRPARPPAPAAGRGRAGDRQPPARGLGPDAGARRRDRSRRRAGRSR